MATAVDRIQDMSAADVRTALNAGEITLIDVREPAEHAAERIAGARLMPMSRFDPANIPNGSGKVVLHCRSGSRSKKAARKLLDSGWESACQLQGGIEAWKSAGFPVERDAKAPISLLRQVQITAGSLVLIGSVLGFVVSPWWFLMSGFVGAGLMFAGLTDTCGMAMLLAKMPWNKTTCDAH